MSGLHHRGTMTQRDTRTTRANRGDAETQRNAVISDHPEITSHLARWAMWRGHSCLLRPDSSGRLPGVLENASRGVGTRQTESLRHIGDREVIFAWSLRRQDRRFRSILRSHRRGQAQHSHLRALCLLCDPPQGRHGVPDVFEVLPFLSSSESRHLCGEIPSGTVVNQ